MTSPAARKAIFTEWPPVCRFRPSTCQTLNGAVCWSGWSQRLRRRGRDRNDSCASPSRGWQSRASRDRLLLYDNTLRGTRVPSTVFTDEEWHRSKTS